MADLHLGFALGADGKPGADPLTVEAADLTTHGVIVGMTGSGKTGLAIDLLEECLLAGVPALVIDPKGDMGNLCLTFPDLSPSSFRPWVDEAAARQEGLTVDEYAERVAAQWREGLAAQGIGPERIQALRDAADVTIYTPGSSAGVPVNVIGSLRRPPLQWETQAEALRDEIEGAVSSLLGLVGVAADPLSSREHVLLANVVETAWRAGRDLDLASLIAQVQEPPFRKLGVFELDAFFPPADRTALALKLNALVAAPAFAAWGEGVPLDLQRMLYAEGGRPRAAIVYLAHLSDEERQFVVTLVLAKLVTWLRGQTGTTDLRALVYMDEVFGYAPPTAAPPSKKPILTILKQARAFGVGMVLSTQNPVDLDYKAMSNAATWLVGRLQTENDKARVLEGLRSAAGGTDVAALDAAVGRLGKRQFLLVSAHEPEPKLFATRWAMSYLRGPLTKEQVQQLTTARPEHAPEPGPPAPPVAVAATADETPVAPAVVQGVPVGYLDPAAPWAAGLEAVPGGTRMRAVLAIRCSLRYDDTKAGLDHQEEWEAVIGPLDGGLDLDTLREVDHDPRDLRPEPPAGAVYVLPEAPLGEASFFRQVARDVEARLVAGRPLELLRNPALRLFSRPGETPDQFAARCDAAAEEKADAEVAKLTDRLAARKERLEDALLAAQQRMAEAGAEADARQRQDVVAGAGALLGALFGGRRSSRGLSQLGRALGGGSSSAAKARARTASAKADETADDLADLELELAEAIEEITAKWDEAAATVETVPIRLEAADVHVVETVLVWIPTA
jgi:hypothetical protein